MRGVEGGGDFRVMRDQSGVVCTAVGSLAASVLELEGLWDEEQGVQDV